jgi:hypothetical protein
MTPQVGPDLLHAVILMYLVMCYICICICTQTWEARAHSMLSLMDSRQGVWSNSVNSANAGPGSAAGGSSSQAAVSSFSGKGQKVCTSCKHYVYCYT